MLSFLSLPTITIGTWKRMFHPLQLNLGHAIRHCIAFCCLVTCLFTLLPEQEAAIAVRPMLPHISITQFATTWWWVFCTCGQPTSEAITDDPPHRHPPRQSAICKNHPCSYFFPPLPNARHHCTACCASKNLLKLHSQEGCNFIAHKQYVSRTDRPKGVCARRGTPYALPLHRAH